jgi:hypothetical protein
MIVCPTCNHSNMTGALYCVECGGQLGGRDTLITQRISGENLKAAEGEQVRGKNPQPRPEDEAWGSLHLVDTGQVILLSSQNEFTLGRVSEGQPIMPDIDLSSYQAYAAGVSRLHAVIRRNESSLTFMDLGSANGSYLNGGRLAPNSETPIQHGDIVALGRLKIQFLTRK